MFNYIVVCVFWDHQVRSCIRQLLEGLDYLHHLNIIHLDIKVDIMNLYPPIIHVKIFVLKLPILSSA